MFEELNKCVTKIEVAKEKLLKFQKDIIKIKVVKKKNLTRE